MKVHTHNKNRGRTKARLPNIVSHHNHTNNNHTNNKKDVQYAKETTIDLIYPTGNNIPYALYIANDTLKVNETAQSEFSKVNSITSNTSGSSVLNCMSMIDLNTFRPDFRCDHQFMEDVSQSPVHAIVIYKKIYCTDDCSLIPMYITYKNNTFTNIRCVK